MQPRTLFILSSAAALGCSATPSTRSASEPVARVESTSDGVSYELGVSRGSERIQIDAPPERVWDALLQTYQSLGIQATYLDTNTRRYGVQRFTGTQLAGRRTSDLVRCSEGAGPSAVAGRRIEVSVLSALRASPGGNTSLETEVSGVSRRMDGTNTPPVRCESTGDLEQLIAAGVRERVLR